MDKVYEKQAKTVEKALISLRKEIPIPNSYLTAFRKFFHYLYSIGYYRGYTTDNNKTKNIIMYYRHNSETFPSIEIAAKYTNISKSKIAYNINGLTSTAEGYQFRYTKRKPTVF